MSADIIMALLHLSIENIIFLFSWKRPCGTVSSVTALTQNKCLIHQVRAVPTLGYVPSSCFEFSYNNERFFMWVTSSVPDCVYCNSSSTSPLSNKCQSLESQISTLSFNFLWPTTNIPLQKVYLCGRSFKEVKVGSKAHMRVGWCDLRRSLFL